LVKEIAYESSLTNAASNGHTDILELLFREVSGISISCYQKTLFVSAKAGHVSACKFLLDTAKVDPTAQDNLALYYAASYDTMAVVELLVMNYTVNLT
jgi:Ankyrin repeats (3 copies)